MPLSTTYSDGINLSISYTIGQVTLQRKHRPLVLNTNIQYYNIQLQELAYCFDIY